MEQKVTTEISPRMIAAPLNSGDRITSIILEDNGIDGTLHFFMGHSPLKNDAKHKSKERSVQQKLKKSVTIHKFFFLTIFIASIPCWNGSISK